MNPSHDDLLLLIAYSDGELAAEAAQRVEARLAADADLQCQLTALRAWQAALAQTQQAPEGLDAARRTAVVFGARHQLEVRRPIRYFTTIRWAAVLLVGGFFGLMGLALLAPNFRIIEHISSQSESRSWGLVRGRAAAAATPNSEGRADDASLMSDQLHASQDAPTSPKPGFAYDGVTPSFRGMPTATPAPSVIPPLGGVTGSSTLSISPSVVLAEHEELGVDVRGGEESLDGLRWASGVSAAPSEKKAKEAQAVDQDKSSAPARQSQDAKDEADYTGRPALAKQEAAAKADGRREQLQHLAPVRRLAPFELAAQLDQGNLVRSARANQQSLRLVGGCLQPIDRASPCELTETFGLTDAAFTAAFGTPPAQLISRNARQTVAITADSAAFARAEYLLNRGQAVDPTAVLPEHFVNAVPADYPPVTGDDAFALYAEAGPSPFAAGRLAGQTALVAVGAQARPATADERRPLRLTLCLDASGSMSRPGGLDRIRLGLAELLPHLRSDDRVAVVAFADRARVVLPMTSGAQADAIANACATITPGGGTNAAEGLALACQVAVEAAAPGVENRVLFASDGAALAGDGAAPVLARLEGARARGVTLLVVGCGDGQGYQAAPLEQLAARGDGEHLFCGDDDATRRLFSERLLPEHLAVLARDAKLQVTWNPARVTAARLIGFTERRLTSEQFRDNRVDAGEIAQAQHVTALFEIILAEHGSGPLGTAAVRFLDTRLGTVRELACPLAGTLVTSQASPRLRLHACAAQLAELLQGSWWADQRLATYAALRGELERCPASPFRDRLSSMAEAAQRLTGEP